MQIRSFSREDTGQIARLFHDTIREVNLGDYSEEQVKAWAPDDIFFKDWKAFCLSKHTFVADDGGIIAGFAQLENNGHIDCFYCHKGYQRKGVGTKLYKAVEQKALEMNLTHLITEASITAKSFFEKKGFTVICSQLVTTRGQVLKNYRMQKAL